MIVADYWAEGRVQGRIDGHQLTVRRFGWSDSSQAEAQQNADSRAGEAFEQIAAGVDLPRRERKLAYNGADGMPIREQIVSRHDDTVITRNSYGALCLNTPDVLFVDVDDDESEEGWRLLLSLLAPVLAAVVVAAALWFESGLVFALTAVIAIALWWRINTVSKRKASARQMTGEERMHLRIDGFIVSHPDWHLRLYRTPAGYRVLAMQRRFDPREPAVDECFDALDADPVYARMCRNQNCFRARVSPKPWRIGIDTHIRPARGTWPVAAEQMPERGKWIHSYEQAAAGFSACRFVAAFGAVGSSDPAARAVQQLHDQLSGADSGLPTA